MSTKKWDFFYISCLCEKRWRYLFDFEFETSHLEITRFGEHHSWIVQVNRMVWFRFRIRVSRCWCSVLASISKFSHNTIADPFQKLGIGCITFDWCLHQIQNVLDFGYDMNHVQWCWLFLVAVAQVAPSSLQLYCCWSAVPSAIYCSSCSYCSFSARPFQFLPNLQRSYLKMFACRCIFLQVTKEISKATVV